MTVDYGSLLNIGGQFASGENDLKKDAFHWLFRTGFDQYERQSAVLLRWVHRMFTWTLEYRTENLGTWRRQSGFRAYDELEAGHLHSVSQYPSYTEKLPKLLAGLVRDLRNACRPT